MYTEQEKDSLVLSLCYLVQQLTLKILLIYNTFLNLIDFFWFQ